MGLVGSLRSLRYPSRAAPSQRLHALAIPELGPELAATLRGIFLRQGIEGALRYPDARGHAPEDPEADIVKSLFLHGEVVATDRVARIMGMDDLDTLIRSGLVHEGQGRLESHFKVQSYRGLTFLSDFFVARNDPNFVLQIGPAGRYLANLTIRQQVATALDLGCGCGVQSLLASRHCTRVTATDINARALALTRLNADLNGISNIEVIQGSYFEPVEGRQFDLVVANLPYVIAPEEPVIYRNTDQPGDGRLRRLIAEIPAYLKEGGFAHILANWIHTPGESWGRPVFEAVSGRGADAWLIYNGSKDVEAYAGMWIDRKREKDARTFARTQKAWAKWYRRQGIEQIALGAVNLRRRTSGRNWFCTARVDNVLEDSAGDQLKRLFAAQDALSALQRPEDLLASMLIPSQMETSVNPGGHRVRVRATTGLRLETEVHAPCLQVLRRLGEGLNLETAADQTARELGTHREEFLPAMLEDIRRLIDLGLVVPA